MSFDWTAVVSAMVAAGLTSAITNAFAKRQERQREARGVRRDAAADLLAPLRDLRSLTRRHGRVDLDQREVASAVRAWTGAIDRQAHRLPDGWRHVGRSVRAAIGEAFGGVTLLDLRPDMADAPLPEPDFVWQDNADEYLGYVVDALARWGDDLKVAPRELLAFDPWLHRTERHSLPR